MLSPDRTSFAYVEPGGALHASRPQHQVQGTQVHVKGGKPRQKQLIRQLENFDSNRGDKDASEFSEIMLLATDINDQINIQKKFRDQYY